MLVVVLLAASAGAQTPPTDTDKKDPQSAVEPRSAPGEGQKFLQKFVGTWDVVKTFHGRDGQVTKTTGSCRQTMIHGGRFLQSEFTFEGANGSSTGTGVIGFESATGKFTSVWFDSRSTRMSHRMSTGRFDGKEIVLAGATLDGSTGRPSRTVTRFEGDGMKIVHQQFVTSENGQERLLMQLVLTKRK